MANATPNLGLVKPELDENFNLKLHLNDNWDKIDSLLQVISEDNGILKFVDITTSVGVETGFYYKSFTHNENAKWECVATPIVCSEGDIFRFTAATVNSDGNQQIVKCYDETQKLIGSYYPPNENENITKYGDKVFIVPTGVAYITFSCWNNGTGKYSLIVEKAEKIEDKDFLITRQLANFNPVNNLYEKRIYSDGDSIAEGAGSGDISYAHLLRDKYNMNLTSCAVTGTTIAIRADRTDSINERILAMTGEYDYIIFDGGTNDINKNVPLGTITDGIAGEFDTTTTLGALESICMFLNTHYFAAKKLFIFTHSHTSILTKMNETYAEMKKVLGKWGIPWIDISKVNNLGCWNTTVATDWYNADDTIHPNLKGYREMYLPYIENALLYGGYINS